MLFTVVFGGSRPCCSFTVIFGVLFTGSVLFTVVGFVLLTIWCIVRVLFGGFVLLTVVFGGVRAVHRDIWGVRVVHWYLVESVLFTVIFGGVRVVHRGIWWGPCRSPWYLVGSVLLICSVFYVVLWCFACLRSVSCVSNVPWCLWIIHS